MKYFLVPFSIAAALLVVGCAGTKPLASIAPDSRTDIRFAGLAKQNSKASFSSVTGRDGRKLISDGLLGGVVGTTVSAVSDANGKEFMPRIRSVTGNFESTLVNERFLQRLSSSGAHLSDDAKASVVELKVTTFGLREVQRGFFAPYVFADAKLITADQKQLWWACAQSVGIHQRRKQEYESNPELYRQDFIEVADDLSRQLIDGPVRAIER